MKGINYLRLGILFARLKKEERIVDFFIRFVSQIACVSHLVGLGHYFLLFFYSFYVSNRVCVPLGGFEPLFFIRFMLKSRVCPTVWVWALLFYVFLSQIASHCVGLRIVFIPSFMQLQKC